MIKTILISKDNLNIKYMHKYNSSNIYEVSLPLLLSTYNKNILADFISSIKDADLNNIDIYVLVNTNSEYESQVIYIRNLLQNQLNDQYFVLFKDKILSTEDVIVYKVLDDKNNPLSKKIALILLSIINETFEIKDRTKNQKIINECIDLIKNIFFDE